MSFSRLEIGRREESEIRTKWCSGIQNGRTKLTWIDGHEPAAATLLVFGNAGNKGFAGI